MSTTLIFTGLCFLLILPSGYLLSRIGKPYHMAIITIHKLAGVALAIYLAPVLIRRYQSGSLAPPGMITTAVTVLFFLVLVVSGSLLSAEREFPPLFKTFHRVFPYLTVLATGVLVWLFI
jgi:hypothetical protein